VYITFLVFKRFLKKSDTTSSSSIPIPPFGRKPFCMFERVSTIVVLEMRIGPCTEQDPDALTMSSRSSTGERGLPVIVPGVYVSPGSDQWSKA